MQSGKSVKAPEYSHTKNRKYAIIQNGALKHLSYYDENHDQAVVVDFQHYHKGVKPHRHYYLDHTDDGIPATEDDLILADKIRRRFNLR